MRLKSFTQSIATVALAATAFVTSPAGAKDFNVTIATGHPPAVLWVRHLRDHFIPEVNKNLEGSGHKINWTQAYGGTVAKVGGELEAIQKSVVDISLVGATFHQAKLNLLNVSYYVPFTSRSVRSTVETVDEMYTKVPEMGRLWEANNAVYLAGVGTDTFQIFTSKPIRSLKDLAGMKIGGIGPNLNWLRGSGAIGVVVVPNTIYNDISTGVFEGVLMATSQAHSTKINEVAPYMLKADIQANYWAGLVINKTTFNSFPKEVQQAVRKAALSYREVLIQDQLRSEIEGLEAMKTAGLKVTQLSDTERTTMAASIPDVSDEWAKSLEDRGLPARKVLNHFLEGLRSRGEIPVRNWNASGTK